MQSYVQIFTDDLNGIQEVSGSIPLFSTKKDQETQCFPVFFVVFRTFSSVTKRSVSLLLH